MKSNEIGKYIYNVLKTNVNVFDLVMDRIFPIVAENGTNYPYIIYTRNASNTQYTKDGIISENCSLTIDCVHTDYSKGVDVALAVREAFDNLVEYPVRFQLESTNESWLEEGVFIQTLNYNIKINV